MTGTSICAPCCARSTSRPSRTWRKARRSTGSTPTTAEVKPVEGIQNALMTHCARQPEFLTQQTALVEAVFRLFLTNGNAPMSSRDMGERLNRPADTILRTLAGPRVYKGIRPYTS